MKSWLWQRVRAVADKRPPDFVISRSGGKEYLRRWWLIPRNNIFNVYLHQFLASDDDCALHDHMYFNLSVILEGEYVEHMILAGGVNRSVRRRAGEWAVRAPWTAHRIEIDRPCWTLFVTGPRVRNWGFHCPNGWVPWQQFVDARDSGKVGRGCEQ